MHARQYHRLYMHHTHTPTRCGRGDSHWCYTSASISRGRTNRAGRPRHPSIPLVSPSQQLDAVRHSSSPGVPRLAAKQHRHCDSCTTYLPASGLPVQCTASVSMRILADRIITGRICKIYTCCEIDPNGCPRSTPQNVWDPIILVALRGKPRLRQFFAPNRV